MNNPFRRKEPEPEVRLVSNDLWQVTGPDATLVSEAVQSAVQSQFLWQTLSSMAAPHGKGVKTMTVAPVGASRTSMTMPEYKAQMANTLYDTAYRTMLGAALDPAINLDSDVLKAVTSDGFTKYIEDRLNADAGLSTEERASLNERLEELKEALKQQTLPPKEGTQPARSGVVIQDKDVLALLTRPEGFRSGLQRVYFSVERGELKARYEDGVLTPQR